MPSEGQTIDLSEGEHLVPPIKAVEVDEAWTRDVARSRLSVPKEAKVVYVQLGAGRINDIESDLNTVLNALFEHENVFVVLGESMLGERLSFTHERLRVIRDYPNALYANGFDASVQAGGYNSFQEMRTFGVPTLFIPNTDTGMDDQVKRCKIAEDEGWGIVNVQPNDSALANDIATLLQRSKSSGYQEENGAAKVVKVLFNAE